MPNTALKVDSESERERPAPASDRHAARQGFTLIELLVVVAILTMLIALLLPALRGAIATARFTACQANEHQIGVAQFNYLSDSMGIFPSFSDWIGLLGQRGTTTYYHASTTDAPARPLNAYLQANTVGAHVSVACCPADQGDPILDNVPNCFASYGTSYLPAYSANYFRTQRVYGKPGLAPLQFRQITRTANKILLGDWDWQGNRPVTDPRTHWHDGFDTNNRRFNMLFTDGHAGFFHFDPLQAIESSLNGGSNYTGTPNPSFLWW